MMACVCEHFSDTCQRHNIAHLNEFIALAEMAALHETSFRGIKAGGINPETSALTLQRLEQLACTP